MRDKIKNIRYFEEYINKKEESNCRIKSWFINGEINPDRREIMLEKMFQNNIYSLISKYSAQEIYLYIHYLTGFKLFIYNDYTTHMKIILQNIKIKNKIF